MSTFTKYIDIERLGSEENINIFSNPDDDIVIEEKVDGGNGCVFIDKDNTLHVCSRSRDLVLEHDDKTFVLQRQYLLSILKQEKMNKQLYYYIEWMQKHTIYYGNIIQVIGLDIIPKEGAFGKKPMFIGREAKERMFKEIGIETVYLKGVYKAREVTEDLIKSLTKDSHYYNGQPEGVVLKNYGRLNPYGRQMFAKVVNDEFKEVNKAVFCNSGLKKDNSETTKVVDMFVTDARIRKAINKLTLERGLPLDRALMGYLVRDVIKDVFKEEVEWIFKMKELNIGIMKQLTNKKCLAVIDNMMMEKLVR